MRIYLDNGATTIWEAWDADDAKKDGRYVSFNHYAFGCVDDWVMRHIAGINTDTVGYNHLIICPDVDSGVLEFTRKFVTNAGVVEVGVIITSQSWNASVNSFEILRCTNFAFL